MTNPITKLMNDRLNKKQRQWAWFVILWMTGFSSVLILASIIKLIMGV